MTDQFINRASHEQNLCLLVHAYYDRISPMCGECESRTLDNTIVRLHRWFRDRFDRKATQLELVYPADHLDNRASDIASALEIADHHRYCAENYRSFDKKERKHFFDNFFLEAFQMFGGDVPGMAEKRLNRVSEVVTMGLTCGKKRDAAAAVLAKG